jgi:hypothetical protein
MIWYHGLSISPTIPKIPKSQSDRPLAIELFAPSIDFTSYFCGWSLFCDGCIKEDETKDENKKGSRRGTNQ